MKKNKEKNELVGGGLPLATANLPTASGSSATPTSGGHPRNAPGEKELQTLRLDEICESIVDCPHSTPKWTEFGLTVLRSHNIRGGKLDLTERSYTDKKHFDERNRRARPQLDDLVITREAPMGEVCIIPDGLECCLGQRMVLLRPNQERVFPKYLLYAIQGDEVQHQISWSEGTGSTVSNLRIPHLQALKIPLPPLPIQKRIASILGTLDDKIALNRRINQTLEAMAQALFQSWFVDFDPVKAKQAVLEAGGSTKDAEFAAMQAISGKSTAELKAFQKSQPEQYAELEATAKLFPGRLVESELGLVPEGWEVKALDCIANYQNGLPLQKFRPESEDEFLPVVKIAQLQTGIADSEEKASVNIRPECIIDNGDVVFSWSGSLLVDLWCGGRAALNQHLFKVTSTTNPKWLFYYFTKRHLDEFQRIASAKAVTMGHIKREHLSQALCAIPVESELLKFSPRIEFMLQKQIEMRLEAKHLVEMRDSLLPKLLSGEIDVSTLGIT